MNDTNKQLAGCFSRPCISLNSVKDGDNNQIVRIMQWNILAQGFCPTSLFSRCSPTILKYETRFASLEAELKRFSVDIFCLEESDLFEQILNCLNGSDVTYAGLFSPKTASACLLTEPNFGPDGTAIIYRSDKFRQLKTETVVLAVDDFKQQNALFVHLEAIHEPNIKFWVICTHLKAKKSFVEIREKQSSVLLEAIDRLVGTDKFIICGDFNASPDEPAITCLKEKQITSLYSLLNVSGEEPEFTTWKFRKYANDVEHEACHTIDYIFYRKNDIIPLNIFKIPTKEEIGSGGLPCTLFPSDHISLIADVSICS